MYVYYYRTYEKAVSGGGGKGVHVLRDTTSRGLCVRVWPPHTSENECLLLEDLVLSCVRGKGGK